MSRRRYRPRTSTVYNPTPPTRRIVSVPVRSRDAPLTMSAAKVLERRLDRLIARGVVDLDPYILHHLGKGPDPDRKRRPRPHSNPWNTVE